MSFLVLQTWSQLCCRWHWCVCRNLSYDLNPMSFSSWITSSFRFGRGCIFSPLTHLNFWLYAYVCICLGGKSTAICRSSPSVFQGLVAYLGDRCQPPGSWIFWYHQWIEMLRSTPCLGGRWYILQTIVGPGLTPGDWPLRDARGYRYPAWAFISYHHLLCSAKIVVIWWPPMDYNKTTFITFEM